MEVLSVSGVGFYSLAEVSRLTRVPPSTVRSWFVLGRDGRARGHIFDSDYERVNDDYAVSFLNLIETYVAAFFRDKGVRPTMIRKAYLVLCKEMGPHPFARSNLSTDGASIIKKERRNRLVDVVNRQQLFNEWERHLEQLQYDHITKLAKSWEIATGVVIQSGVAFGKPVLKTISVPTAVVANQFVANNKDAALVAKLFSITKRDVLHAYEFEHSRGRAA